MWLGRLPRLFFPILSCAPQVRSVRCFSSSYLVFAGCMTGYKQQFSKFGCYWPQYPFTRGFRGIFLLSPVCLTSSCVTDGCGTLREFFSVCAFLNEKFKECPYIYRLVRLCMCITIITIIVLPATNVRALLGTGVLGDEHL